VSSRVYERINIYDSLSIKELSSDRYDNRLIKDIEKREMGLDRV
jgi:hypothetical protein